MFLSNVVASGTPESIGGALLTALLGYVVVFFGLYLLMIVVIILGKIMTAKNAKEAASAPAAPAAAAPAAPAAAPAPGSAGKLKLYDTPDKEAAMIMAIVANQMGRPLNELRFISIKEVK
ncbi:MAG TPA: OadG family protein [Candidatus Avoscillospira stercoripullorum]|uniref:OadG family protein n=1 Tax=Candidatus Avoscillospira stercoripullorum TaxID=2840709 RepID=A0A9D1A9J7_9FIRM|nr:OadG family protein [Candidatus Avoscillospira stercoripullorum]